MGTNKTTQNCIWPEELTERGKQDRSWSLCDDAANLAGCSWPCLSRKVGLEDLRGPFHPQWLSPLWSCLQNIMRCRNKANPQNLLWERKEQVSSLVFLVAYPLIWLKVPKYEGSVMGSLNSSVSSTNILPLEVLSWCSFCKNTLSDFCSMPLYSCSLSSLHVKCILLGSLQ